MRESPHLTTAELDVMRLTAEGKSPTEIGEIRHATPKTIKAQLRFAVMRLNARNVPHAVFVACGLGLITPPKGPPEADASGEPTEPYNHETVARVYRSGDVEGAREMTEHGGKAWGGRSRAEGKS